MAEKFPGTRGFLSNRRFSQSNRPAALRWRADGELAALRPPQSAGAGPYQKLSQARRQMDCGRIQHRPRQCLGAAPLLLSDLGKDGGASGVPQRAKDWRLPEQIFGRDLWGTGGLGLKIEIL